MSMVSTVLLALGGGALIGRAIRHAVPSILSLKDRASLPFSSPWLEFVGAGVFALLALRLGGPGSFPLWWIFTVLLLAISATDYLVKLIPDRLTFSGTVLAIGWNSFEPEFLIGFSHGHRSLVDWWSSTLGQLPAGLLLSISGALLGLLVLECIRGIFGLMVGMQVMGMGDSKLLMMIGAFLGPSGVLGSLALGFLLGVIHGLACYRISGQPHSPFGPPLAAAGLGVLLSSHLWVSVLEAFRGWVLRLSLELLAAIYTVLIVVVVLLLVRTRRRAKEYEAMIEEDYRRVDDQLE